MQAASPVRNRPPHTGEGAEQADKEPIPRMERDGEQGYGKELQSSQLIYTIFMNLKDSESRLEKLDRKSQRKACISLL